MASSSTLESTPEREGRMAEQMLRAYRERLASELAEIDRQLRELSRT
jgi:hypothetical protein